MNTSKKGCDWHPADIKAALEKAGWNFTRISREYGYAVNSPSNVLRMPWSTMERIVADIIGVEPNTIWSSRYDRNGRPLRSRSPRPNCRKFYKNTSQTGF